MATTGDREALFEDTNQVSSVLKMLYEQRSASRFCDVILRVCGEQIFAHANVLAAASPYFAALFLQDLPRAFSQKTPQIIEIHIDGSEGQTELAYGEAVRKVVDFMYTNTIALSYSVLTQVIEIARIMQMNNILDYCDKFQQGQNGNGDETVKLISGGAGGPGPGNERSTQTGLSENTGNISDNDSPEEPDVADNDTIVDDEDEAARKKLRMMNVKAEKSSKSTPKKRGRPRKTSYEPGGKDGSCESEQMSMTEEEKSAFRIEYVPSVAGKKQSSKKDSDLEIVIPTRKSARLRLSGRSRHQSVEGEIEAVKAEAKLEEGSTEDKEENTPQGVDLKSYYVCSVCDYHAGSLVAYRKHRKSHDNIKYVCDKCEFTSTKMKELNKHKREHMHAENQCSFCGWVCPNKDGDSKEFEEHLAKHSGPHPYFCSTCDMRFRTRTQLNLHSPKHSKVKPFVCNICNAGFKWKHAVINHMITHKETKDHLCDVCGFTTAHKSQLKAHRLIHTGETFKCMVEGCNFQATKRQNLKYHTLTHTHEKPHQCEICGQAFSLNKNMKRHMLLHTNERPFKCEHCSFSTTRYDKLKEHYFKQHNIGEKPGKKLRLSDYQEVTELDQMMIEDMKNPEDSELERNGEEEMQTIEVQVADGDDLSAAQLITHMETATGEAVPVAITTMDGDIHLAEVQYPNIQLHLVAQVEGNETL